MMMQAPAAPQPAPWPKRPPPRLPPRPPQPPAEPAETGQVVKSPMVGTFYRSASPAPSLCRVGDRSRKASRLHHRGHEDHERDRGRLERHQVTKILCENGQAVEFGQPLFIVE
jgi:acetyl-CoA carboxylase biotin carboxyl carrier protein